MAGVWLRRYDVCCGHTRKHTQGFHVGFCMIGYVKDVSPQNYLDYAPIMLTGGIAVVLLTSACCLDTFLSLKCCAVHPFPHTHLLSAQAYCCSASSGRFTRWPTCPRSGWRPFRT